MKELMQFLIRFLDAFRVGKRCTCGLREDPLAEATGGRMHWNGFGMDESETGWESFTNGTRGEVLHNGKWHAGVVFEDFPSTGGIGIEVVCDNPVHDNTRFHKGRGVTVMVRHNTKRGVLSQIRIPGGDKPAWENVFFLTLLWRSMKAEFPDLRWFAYTSIFLAMFVTSWPLIPKLGGNDDLAYFDVKMMPAKQVEAELEAVIKTARENIGNPVSYFEALTKLRKLQSVCSKAESRSQWGSSWGHWGNVDVVIPYRTLNMRINSSIDALQGLYNERHKGPVMANTSKAYFERHPENNSFRRVDANTQPLKPLWAQLYFNTLPFAFLFFILRLKAKDFRLSLELVQIWKPALATLVWPVGVFKYPDGEAGQQLVSALRFAGLVLATGLSLGTAGIAKAQESGDNNKKRGGDKVLVVDAAKKETATGSGKRPSAWSISNVTFNLGASSKYIVKIGHVPHNKPVIQSDVTVTLRNGVFVNLWGSTGTDFRSNGGREADYTIGWAGKNVRVGLAYYDFAPVAKRHGTDVVNPFVEFSRSFPVRSHKLQAFALLDWINTTKNSSTNSAAIFTGGLRHSWTRKRWTISQGAQLSYDAGVFGGNHGFVGMYSLAVSAKVSNRMTLTPFTMRIHSPVAGIRDERKFQRVFGASAEFRWNTSSSSPAGTATGRATGNYKLTSDTRFGEPLPEGQVHQGFQRVTLLAPNGFVLFETVHNIRPNFWSHATVAGPRAFKNKTTTINLVAGFSNNSAGISAVMVSPQVFFSNNWLNIGTPLIRWERQLTPRHATTFAWNTEASFRAHGKIWLGGEVLLRKKFGSPVQYTAGPTLRIKMPGGFFELAGLRNNIRRENALRVRLVHNFSF